MTQRLDVATRKGLFTIERAGGAWTITGSAFLGDNCSMVLRDPRDPKTVYCALDHGHFGVKMHRSDDAGRTWSEVGVPVYPPKPEGHEPQRPPAEGKPAPWDLKLVWTLEPAGPNEPDALWAGTAPGGLFRSDDRGASWTLNRPLWDDPGREAWFGGGYDYPAIHSICVDPRDAAHVTVGVSCGGVWVTRDSGATWTVQADGMRADFMPPEQAGDPLIQDPIACGHSITAASTGRRMPHAHGNQCPTSSRRCLASPSRCTRKIPTPRGSCRR
jgi:hypothetical protein